MNGCQEALFSGCEGALDAKLLIAFIERLVRDADRKIHLILDNLRVHHPRPVKAWLAEHR